MIAERDMVVGQIVVDGWYFTGESGEIISIKGRMLRARFGSTEKVYDVDEAKKLLSVKRG